MTSAQTYDAAQRTDCSRAECEAAVGRRATLTLTGTIIEARESEAGPHVVFEIDSRWGFAQRRFVMDLDPLELNG